MQQVIVGLDTAEMISEIESLSQSDIDFGIDEFDDEDSDVDSDDEEDDDEEEDDDSYAQVATCFFLIFHPFSLGRS